jgi:hypothetical protein
MLQVFYLNVAYVALAIHVCCKYMFQMFQCFKYMLQVFYLDVAYVVVSYTYVASVCFKYFICFEHMLQQMLYIASVS